MVCYPTLAFDIPNLLLSKIKSNHANKFKYADMQRQFYRDGYLPLLESTVLSVEARNNVKKTK